MENSRTPLHKWMTAVKLLAHPDSVNAVQLTSIINVTYKTAFYMLRKIRVMLTLFDLLNRLSGNVHASYCYPKTRMTANPFCRDAKDVPVMIGASFDGDGAISYLKLKPGLRLIAHTKYGVKNFKDKHVDPACRSFNFHIGGRIYTVQPMPMLLSQVVTWIGRTFKGVSAKYLEHYLDEFSFRHNRGLNSNQLILDISRCMMSGTTNKILSKSVVA